MHNPEQCLILVTLITDNGIHICAEFISQAHKLISVFYYYVCTNICLSFCFIEFVMFLLNLLRMYHLNDSFLFCLF